MTEYKVALFDCGTQLGIAWTGDDGKRNAAAVPLPRSFETVLEALEFLRDTVPIAHHPV